MFSSLLSPSIRPRSTVGCTGIDGDSRHWREAKLGQRLGHLVVCISCARSQPSKRELDSRRQGLSPSGSLASSALSVVLYLPGSAAMAGGELHTPMTTAQAQTQPPPCLPTSPSTPTAACASPSAMVSFPASDSSPTQAAHPPEQQLPPTPAQYLPFRRISLPSAPNLQHRVSVVSTASFDSVPEAGEPLSAPISSSPSKTGVRGTRPHAASVDALRRNQRRREVKSVVVDEQREAKRRKVIHELHETERTYLEGLELIYSVRTVRPRIRSVAS